MQVLTESTPLLQKEAMSDEKEEFKVIDRRGTPKEPSAEGAGFTMKEKQEEPQNSVQIDFSALVLSLGTGALIHLGLAPDPVTNQVVVNLELAKQNIEILSLLQQKTKGNLTPDEGKLLESLLTEIRLRFVEKTSKK